MNQVGARLLASEEEKNTDQQLVDRVFKGDKHAFDLLVLRYQHRILGLIGRFIRDPAEVEDVAQEAFIKAYRALPKFRGDSAFYTWLYRIAINTAKNHMVARGRRPPATDIDVEDAEFMEHNTALRDIGSPEANQEKDDLSPNYLINSWKESGALRITLKWIKTSRIGSDRKSFPLAILSTSQLIA